jgi:hypothetical protein
MGVWGLTSLITPDHNGQDGAQPRGERVCLSEEAVRRREEGEAPLTLIIDGTGFLVMVWEKLGPKWECVLGGEHRAMQEALREYITLLQRDGVELMVTCPPHAADSP